MGKWVMRGLGTVALALTAGGSWMLTTGWGEIHVVDGPRPGRPDGTSVPRTSSTALTATTASAGPPTTAAPPPPCRLADERSPGDPTRQWATIVVDDTYGLPASYEPPDLVDARQAGFEDGSDRIRRVVVDDLSAMRQAAADNGTPIVLVSGYRSYARQAELFAEAVAQQGPHEARLTTARPGHSEHQLGTTIDVLDEGSGELRPAFADTPAGRWLAAHAHRYGFVFSFPDVAVERSCYTFEPWHLRYVGRDVARQIVDSGLTPREWMLTHRAT